jgi:hypothetical protein
VELPVCVVVTETLGLVLGVIVALIVGLKDGVAVITRTSKLPEPAVTGYKGSPFRWAPHS